ncbi:MAG: helix-turn-helix transcriptional regulator [bacterium]
MHDHLKIAGAILILILGLGVIFYLLNLKNKYRDYSLKWLLYYIAAYNAAILLVLTRKYIEINLSSILKSFPFIEFTSDAEMILNVLRLASIITIIGYLKEADISKIVKKACIILEVFIAVLILTKYSFYANTTVNQFVTQFFDYLSQVIFYYEPFLLVLLFAQNIRKEASLQKSLIISFSVLFIMRYVFFLCFYVIPINIIGYYDKFLQAILILSSILVFNVMPLIWLRYFYVKYHSSAPEVKPDENNLVFEKHGITEREKEIVKLVLEGKTNKEIEETLFLSKHTVKNHIYHIYQKLGINSRYQLIKIFHEV